MIFVTVGTHNEGFDRLVRAADLAAETRSEKVVIQKGASSYAPRHAEFFDFASSAHVRALSEAARVIVTHAGAGSVLTSLETGAAVVVAPRLKAYGEHMDDHQLELAEALQKQGKALVVTDLDALPGVLDQLPVKRSATGGAEAPLVPYLKRRLGELSRRQAA